jgi:hypothetical protein
VGEKLVKLCAETIKPGASDESFGCVGGEIVREWNSVRLCFAINERKQTVESLVAVVVQNEESI